jgi:hypothetical protein
VDAGGAGLARGHGLRPLDQRRIPRGGEGDRHGQDRPPAVDDVEAEEDGEAVPVAGERESLQAVAL